ncbi:MAG: hypothetical protein ACTSYQ_05050 [Candidatus Odinarchaeia archaeon]
MNIDIRLNQIKSLISMEKEESFNPQDLQNQIDLIWLILDNLRGKVNDVVLNKLCNLITKISIILDAYKAKMIKFENFRVYVEREKLISDLSEITKIITAERNMAV